MLPFTTSFADHDTMVRLLWEALHVEHRVANEHPERLTGREWAQRFIPLGHELRRRGLASRLRQTTFTDPMDPIALRALFLACQAGEERSSLPHLMNLIHVLTSILDGEPDELERFRGSVKSLIGWIMEDEAVFSGIGR